MSTVTQADRSVDSAIPRSWVSWRPWRLRDGLSALRIWVLTATLVLYLGLNGGGYDLVVSSDAAVIVWWVVLLIALVGVIPAARPGRAASLATGLMIAFAGWEAVAQFWTISSERSLQELSRVLCYLGVLVLALSTYKERRTAARHVVSAVGATLVALALVAVLSRLRPGLFPASQTTSSFLPGAQGRLSWPINYWNALAALMALGLPLLLSVATSARRLVARAAAAAAVPVVALCAYLTFSRAGAVAGAAALIIFVTLAPDRFPKLATIALCSAGSAVVIAAASHRPAIEQGLTTSAAHHEGATLLVVTLLACAGVAVAQVGLGLAARHGTPPRFLQVSARRARHLLVAALTVGVVGALAAGAPHRLARAWHAFKQPNAAALHQNALGRFGALSGHGRYTYWATAVHAMPGHWLKGYGPGTFELVWLPRAKVASYVRNAHSLYIETLTDAGIPGLLLIAGFLITVLAVAVRRVVAERFEARAHAAAITAACFAFTVTAAFDWVWQVPVLPVIVMLLAAAVLVPATRAESGGRHRSLSGRARVAAFGRRVALTALAAASLLAVGIPLAGTNAVRASQAAARSGDTTTALAAARSAVNIEPSSMSAHLQEALVLELQDRLPAALVAAREAVAEEPENWQPWLILSRLDAEAGHPGPATSAYRRARLLNPQSPVFP